ncbi:MAG: SDR family NAD(P)-dependent oxidoreductase [Clostridiaceae bacterium]|nr:SDR family NAD(P)-dependent oxidoreductase [Clostridiaceae bacterium]
MTHMANWIEKSGGEKAAIAAIAPALRGLLVGGRFCHVRYEPESQKAADLIVDTKSCADLEEVYHRLEQPAGRIGQSIATIRIQGLGDFYLSNPVKKKGGRLAGRVCLVTGGAQGFGEGIARELAAAGGTIVIADLNLPLAQEVAGFLNKDYGQGTAVAIGVDVGDEESVRSMIEQIVRMFGGLDLLVSNAGVLRAGGLEEMTLETFEFVTRINYTAFFLVAKYGSRSMKIQARFDPNYTGDIVQINSKSGLEGSNRNFAYAGGKFGGIGLVQSFAKELVGHRIKVNAICPGNYYEGPLWSDPEKGLFVQYLNTGKVPGATSIQEVYDFYVDKVPMRRGCSPVDVTRAILYCVEQQYETGQAIPVTGGQNMLK